MKLKQIEHIGIVVKNLNSAIDKYRDILGLKLDAIEYIEEHNVKIALFSIGEVLIEFIEDQDPDGKYSEFIREKGQGIHHICFEVDDIDNAFKEMNRPDVKLHSNGPLPGHQQSRIAFLNLEDMENITIELCEKKKK